MGKILALDFGLKRTGVAITDELKIIASPLETVPSDKLMTYLETLLNKERIEIIVIGEPKRMDDSETHITKNVYLLKEALEKKFTSIKIDLHDERFTSKMASESMILSGMKKKDRQKKENLDMVSAAIILQSYMAMHFS